jgi:urease accessory protein
MGMSDWLTWQVVDSAFPAGAFAHSAGLESAWQHGEIAGIDDLQAFVRASLLQTGYGVFPLLNAAHRAPERFEALDARAEAFLINAVANRASRTQGRALLSTIARVWPSASICCLSRRAATAYVHVAPISGAAFCAIGLPLLTTQRVVAFATVRAILSAAVRLGIVGSYEGQRLQSEFAPSLDHLLDRCRHVDENELAQTAPIVDLLQSRHDRLYSRLFQS